MTAWARIKRLLRTRRQHKPLIESNQAAMNKMPTIDRLPPEILSVIFLHIHSPFGRWEDPGYIPGVLGQVCRLWRALTLALPGLWASLNITCNYHFLHPQLRTIHTHLQRSATHPLSIVLNTYDPDYYAAPPNPHFPAVLAALVAARHRWRCVSIRLAPEATREALDAITQGDAPLLEMFCCKIEGHTLPELPPIPLRALQGCPRLESLAWYSMRAPMGPALGDEAWGQLTMIRLEASLAASDCFTLLQLSPRLSWAEFQEIDSLGVTPSHQLLHATLHALQATGPYTLTLISALTLPALVDLRLDIRVPPAPHPSARDPVLPAFLARSMPPLRLFSIANLRLPEADLLRALALSPGLHSFSMTEFSPGEVSFTAALIDALHPSSSFSSSSPRAGSPLCPHLSKLQLSVPFNVSDGVWTTMLRARWGAAARANGVACLEEAYISFRGDIHTHDLAEMKRLNEEGMLGALYRAY